MHRSHSRRDDAVSPVIAVILMVAITVVLAATVYIWVSSFSGSSGSATHSLSLVSNGPESAAFERAYTVSSASPGLRYQDLALTVDGTAYPLIRSADPADGQWAAAAGSTTRASTDVVLAGDTWRIDGAASLVGKTLRVVDAGSNSLILSLTL